MPIVRAPSQSIRTGTRLGAAFAAALLATAPPVLGAQIMVTTADLNLRPGHSTHDPPLGVIARGDTLSLLAPDTTNGFVHARTKDARTGWVYSRYVAFVHPPAAAPPTAGPIAAPAPSAPIAVSTAPADYHSCPSVGRNNSGNTPAAPIQAMNLLKNRYTAPRPAEIDSAITLAALVAPGNDEGRFRANEGAEIVGVVTDVMVGGKETTNCEATDPEYRDTHIRIGLTPDAPENQRMVVEVTPRWRAAMAGVGVDWSTSALMATLVGRRVRVVGWMLFDREHASESENLNPGNPKNWRATVWEIHPITMLEVLPQ